MPDKPKSVWLNPLPEHLTINHYDVPGAAKFVTWARRVDIPGTHNVFTPTEFEPVMENGSRSKVQWIKVHRLNTSPQNGVAPGTYVFCVAAIDEKGNWSEITESSPTILDDKQITQFKKERQQYLQTHPDSAQKAETEKSVAVSDTSSETATPSTAVTIGSLMDEAPLPDELAPKAQDAPVEHVDQLETSSAPVVEDVAVDKSTPTEPEPVQMIPVSNIRLSDDKCGFVCDDLPLVINYEFALWKVTKVTGPEKTSHTEIARSIISAPNISLKGGIDAKGEGEKFEVGADYYIRLAGIYPNNQRGPVTEQPFHIHDGSIVLGPVPIPSPVKEPEAKPAESVAPVATPPIPPPPTPPAPTQSPAPAALPQTAEVPPQPNPVAQAAPVQSAVDTEELLRNFEAKLAAKDREYQATIEKVLTEERARTEKALQEEREKSEKAAKAANDARQAQDENHRNMIKSMTERVEKATAVPPPQPPPAPPQGSATGTGGAPAGTAEIHRGEIPPGTREINQPSTWSTYWVRFKGLPWKTIGGVAAALLLLLIGVWCFNNGQWFKGSTTPLAITPSSKTTSVNTESVELERGHKQQEQVALSNLTNQLNELNKKVVALAAGNHVTLDVTNSTNSIGIMGNNVHVRGDGIKPPSNVAGARRSGNTIVGNNNIIGDNSSIRISSPEVWGPDWQPTYRPLVAGVDFPVCTPYYIQMEARQVLQIHIPDGIELRTHADCIEYFDIMKGDEIKGTVYRRGTIGNRPYNASQQRYQLKAHINSTTKLSVMALPLDGCGNQH